MEPYAITIVVTVVVAACTQLLIRVFGKSDRNDESFLEIRRELYDLKIKQIEQELRLKDHMGGNFSTKQELHAVAIELKSLRGMLEQILRRMSIDAALPDER